MLDTTVFNHLLRDGQNRRALSARGPVFITDVQRNELEATPIASRRKKLLALLVEVGASEVPTQSPPSEDSRLEAAAQGGEGRIFDRVLAALDRLNGGKANNSRDALIAETAIRNQLELVTDDRHLATAVREAGGHATGLRNFLREGPG